MFRTLTCECPKMISFAATRGTPRLPWYGGMCLLSNHRSIGLSWDRFGDPFQRIVCRLRILTNDSRCCENTSATRQRDSQCLGEKREKRLAVRRKNYCPGSYAATLARTNRFGCTIEFTQRICLAFLRRFFLHRPDQAGRVDFRGHRRRPLVWSHKWPCPGRSRYKAATIVYLEAERR